MSMIDMGSEELIQMINDDTECAGHRIDISRITGMDDIQNINRSDLSELMISLMNTIRNLENRIFELEDSNSALIKDMNVMKERYINPSTKVKVIRGVSDEHSTI